ncbi:MAG TPA: hypothetical protein PKC21_02930 [Oligoflexia bacterium]|nr:hypothetical protein [Oligoflexia bacterium]HMR24287.1 hypothetical protein [Oligoflexia bacterium]
MTKHLLQIIPGFILLFSSVVLANQKLKTQWTGSTQCEVIVKINADDAFVVADLAKSLLNHGLSYHPSSSFLTETGQIFIADKKVSTKNIHFTHPSCIAELQTHCLTWLEALELNLLPFSSQNLITVSNLSLVSSFTKLDPKGTGCWPIDNKVEPEFEPDTQPIGDHDPDFDVRNNFVQPEPLPVILPIPTGPMGMPQTVIIQPGSKAYPFAAELARILADQDIEQWVKNTILAILGTGTVAAVLLAVGGVTNGGLSTSLSFAPLIAAGTVIIWICHMGGIDVDEQALKLKNNSTSSIDTYTIEKDTILYTVKWDNNKLSLEFIDKQNIKIMDGTQCVKASHLSHHGDC